jgi:hypothetical protein
MVKWKWGIHQFEFDVNQKKWTESPRVNGRATEYKNNSYLAIWDARWSPQWRTQVHYVKADRQVPAPQRACSTDGLGRTQISAGVATTSQAHLALLHDAVAEERHSANFASGSQQGNLGEDITQYGLGIHHSF